MKPWFSGLTLGVVQYVTTRTYVDKFLEMEAFNLYTAQSVQKSILVPYMEVFLIDS